MGFREGGGDVERGRERTSQAKRKAASFPPFLPFSSSLTFSSAAFLIRSSFLGGRTNLPCGGCVYGSEEEMKERSELRVFFVCRLLRRHQERGRSEFAMHEHCKLFSPLFVVIPPRPCLFAAAFFLRRALAILAAAEDLKTFPWAIENLVSFVLLFRRLDVCFPPPFFSVFIFFR